MTASLGINSAPVEPAGTRSQTLVPSGILFFQAQQFFFLQFDWEHWSFTMDAESGSKNGLVKRNKGGQLVQNDRHWIHTAAWRSRDEAQH